MRPLTIDTVLSANDQSRLEQAIVGRQRLRLKAACASEALNSLMSAETLSKLASRERFRTGRATALQFGRILPDAPLAGRDDIDLGALRQALGGGVSLLVEKIGELEPAVKELQGSVSARFRVGVSVNAYASIGGGAFPSHWDDHDVLIIQTEGRKRWQFYGCPIPDPVETGSFPNPGLAADHPAESVTVLEAGDLAFIPRGHVHRAETLGDETSVHLSLALISPRGGDVFQWIAGSLADQVDARADLCLLRGRESLAEQAVTLKNALHRAVDEFNIFDFLADWDDRLSR